MEINLIHIASLVKDQGFAVDRVVRKCKESLKAVFRRVASAPNRPQSKTRSHSEGNIGSASAPPSDCSSYNADEEWAVRCVSRCSSGDDAWAVLSPRFGAASGTSAAGAGSRGAAWLDSRSEDEASSTSSASMTHHASRLSSCCTPEHGVEEVEVASCTSMALRAVCTVSDVGRR